MKNIFQLNKKEIKKEKKAFNKTFFGKGLYFYYISGIVSLITLMVCIILDIISNENVLNITVEFICFLLAAIFTLIANISYFNFFKDYYTKKLENKFEVVNEK